MNENKTNINWLISIYPTLSKNTYKQGFARFKILHFFIKRIKVLCKNNNKRSKILYQIKVGIFSQRLVKIYRKHVRVFLKIVV